MESSFSLKHSFKSRIINEVIKQTLQQQNTQGLVLILDAQSSVFLKDILTMQELIENGVTFVENINVKRKSYQTLSSIYLIQPTKENLNKVQEDFGSIQLYKKLNLFFTEKVPDDLLAYFKMQSSVKKVSTFKEINLNFSIVSSFIFKPLKAGFQGELDSIVSVISTLKNISSIHLNWLKNPLFAKANKLADELSQPLYQIKPLIQPKEGEAGRELQVFVLERGFDLVTPLINDFFYENLLLDFLQLDLDKIQIKGKTYEVKYDDQVY